MDAFVEQTQATVTGEVRLRLCRGTVEAAGSSSPYSLYAKDIASFTMGSFDPKDAEGFINLIGLPVQVRAAVQAKVAAPSAAPAGNTSSTPGGNEKALKDPLQAVGRTV